MSQSAAPYPISQFIAKLIHDHRYSPVEFVQSLDIATLCVAFDDWNRGWIRAMVTREFSNKSGPHIPSMLMS